MTTEEEYRELMVCRTALYTLGTDDGNIRSAIVSLSHAIMARCPHDRVAWERETSFEYPLLRSRTVLVTCPQCRAFTYERERMPDETAAQPQEVKQS